MRNNNLAHQIVHPRTILSNAIALFLLLFTCAPAFGDSYKVPEHLVFSTLYNAYHPEISERILRTVYANLGVTIEVQAFPAARSLEQASSGVVDGELHRVTKIEKDHPTLLRVEPALHSLVGELFAKNDTLVINDVESLRQQTVGILVGIAFSANYVEQNNIPHIACASQEQLFELLEEGRVDVVLTTRTVFDSYAKEHGPTNIRALKSLVELPLYHYLHKKHAPLVPLVSEELRKMQQSGELKQIIQEILGKS